MTTSGSTQNGKTNELHVCSCVYSLHMNVKQTVVERLVSLLVSWCKDVYVLSLQVNVLHMFVLFCYYKRLLCCCSFLWSTRIGLIKGHADLAAYCEYVTVHLYTMQLKVVHTLTPRGYTSILWRAHCRLQAGTDWGWLGWACLLVRACFYCSAIWKHSNPSAVRWSPKLMLNDSPFSAQPTHTHSKLYITPPPPS